MSPPVPYRENDQPLAEWWTVRDSQDAAKAALQAIRAVQSWRDRELRQYVQLVDCYEREKWLYVGDDLQDWVGGLGRETQLGIVVSNNILAPAVDTLTARLFSELPTVSVRVRRGNYDLHMKARRLQMALDSILFTEDSLRELMEVQRDGLKTGIGIARVVLSGNEPRIERISLTDLFWNPEDARYTTTVSKPPRQLTWRQRISRSVLIDTIRDWEYGGDDISTQRKNQLVKAIEALPSRPVGAIYEDYSGSLSYYDRVLQGSETDAASDQVTVYHTWRLPSDKDSKDGRYIVHAYSGTSGEPVVIWDGCYKLSRYPLVWWTPYPAHMGLVGRGVGHQILPYQRQVDMAWQRLEELIEVFGKATLGVPSALDDNQIGNIVSPGINVLTLPPSVLAQMQNGHVLIKHEPQPIQLLEWVSRCKAECYESIGLNSGVMQGGTRLGANASGTALRVEDTRSDVRFGDVLRQSDAFLCSVGDVALMLIDEHREADGSWAAEWADKWGDYHSDKWGELRLEPGTFALEVTGATIRSKAQRVRILEEWMQRQSAPPQMVMQQIANSADEAYTAERMTAAEDLVEWQLFWLTQPAKSYDEYWPDEHTPADVAKDRALREIQIAKRQRAKDDTLARLIAYFAKAEDLAPTPEPQPPAMPGMPPDMAMPGAPGLPPDMGALMMPPGVM